MKFISQLNFIGNQNKLLDLFVELGYDCYQSIQHSAGMDLADVKQKIGDKLVLWGEVSVELIIDGTMEKVRGAVRRTMEIGNIVTTNN